jgi:phosphohistidine phosphatase
MTFHLYIMRHAKSDWADAGKSDFDRPINKRGEKSAIRIGLWMVENGRLPQKIISSAAIRAKQTIELVKKQFNSGESGEIIYEKDLYLADPNTLLEFIQLYKNDVSSLMIVAHNPGLEQLIHFLSTESDIQHKSMSTANLAIFEYPDSDFEPEADKGKLIEFIRPKELE